MNLSFISLPLAMGLMFVIQPAEAWYRVTPTAKYPAQEHRVIPFYHNVASRNVVIYPRSYNAPRVVTRPTLPRYIYQDTYGAIGAYAGDRVGGRWGGIAGGNVGSHLGESFYSLDAGRRYYAPRPYGMQTTTPYRVVPRD